MLEEMIRVDQAGELGANWIYRGQYAVLGSDKKVGPLLQVSVAVLVAVASAPSIFASDYVFLKIVRAPPSSSTCGIRRSTT